MTETELLSETIRTLPQAIAWWTQRTPDAPALEALGWESASYAQLWQILHRLRSPLHAAGIGRGSRLALLLPDGLPLTLVSLAAISTATAATLDSDLREREIERLFAQIRVDALLTADPGNAPDHPDLASPDPNAARSRWAARRGFGRGWAALSRISRPDVAPGRGHRAPLPHLRHDG